MLVHIDLEQLRCISQGDGGDGANPYLWTELLQIDDDTIASGAPVFAADHPVPVVASRLVIKSGMKAGDSAPVPDEVARLGARFRSDPPPLARRDLILVAVLLDQRDTPGAAIEAGYEEFLGDLRDAVAANLAGLASTNEADRKDLEAQIKCEVNKKVKAVIAAKLSILDELGTLVSVESQDSVIGAGFVVFGQDSGASPLVSGPFTLALASVSGDDCSGATAGAEQVPFELDGQLQVTDDPCEDELILVESLQAAIQNTEGRQRQLGSAHHRELTPQEEQELNQLRAELVTERTRLKSAQDALQQCRDRIRPVPPKPLVDTGPAPLHTPDAREGGAPHPD
jgi:hypothetical protein